MIELLLGGDRAAAIRARVEPVTETLHAPHLVDLETVQVLRRLNLAGKVSDLRARAVIEGLSSLDLVRHDHDVLLGRIWALRANLSAYDASYVALAEVLDAPLLTLDGRLARRRGHRARVEVA